MARCFALVLLGATLVGATAFGPLTCLDAETDSDDPSAVRARAIWIEDCADCHGLRGDGKGAQGMVDGSRAPGFAEDCRELSDERVERVILSGGAEFRGDSRMRAHHQLRHDPRTLEHLVEFVRAVQADGCQPPGPDHESP